jgi:alginate O-acetyltransferase complex protein AlgI
MPVATLLKNLALNFLEIPGRWSHAAVWGFSLLHLLFLGSLFLLSCMAVAGGTYNPFIYFKF